MAEAMHTWLQVVVNGHPLIKNITFPMPTTLRFRNLLQVIKNAPLQMVNIRKTLL